MLAAILICGATTFTSCTNDDNPATPDLNLSEKIIGKWMVTNVDGQVAPTNEMWIISILSPTKALLSASLNERPEIGTFWFEKGGCRYLDHRQQNDTHHEARRAYNVGGGVRHYQH